MARISKHEPSRSSQQERAREAIRKSITTEQEEEAEDMQEEEETALGVLKSIFFSPISLLLVCAPFGMASSSLGWGDFATFWLNFLAMIPLAKILGDATEELAACLKNDTLSGLLNATFGNAVEMIMTVCLLRQGQYFVVKTTLVGSMLSNMLLVLGSSFFLGGIWGVRSKASTDSSDDDEEGGNSGREQTFNILGAMTNTSMLILSALVLVLCTVFESVGQGGGLWANPDDPAAHDPVIAQFEREEIRKDTLPVSHYCAILILICYLAYVVFQLVTHSDNMSDGDDEDEDGGSALGLRGALALMACATFVVSVCSEFLTNALQGALADSHLSKGFVGVVLMPVIGNACEHASAVRFAFQDKMGLSMSIAVGSSVQIALCVAPFAVIMGWIIGNNPAGENMTLNFGLLNVSVITMSVILILAVVIDGKSNWLEGFMLVVAYLVIAVLYWYLPDPADEASGGAAEVSRVSGRELFLSLWHA